MEAQSKIEPQHQPDDTIPRLIRRLRPHNRVRQIAERLLHSDWQMGFPDQPFQTLLNSLEHPEFFLWREQTVAAWALSQAVLHSQQKHTAAKVLQHVLKPARVSELRARLHQNSVGRVLFLYFLLVAYLALKPHDMHSNPVIIGILITGLAVSLLFIPIAQVHFDRCYNQLRVEATRTLGGWGLPQSAAILTALCGQRTTSARQVRQAALEALPVVLSQLTPEDYGLHGSEIVPDLCRLLFQSEEPLALSILEALGKIGDGRAVVPVQRLAAKGRTERLRAAAASILPVLEQRRNAENDPQVLLRASRVAHPSATLLRPASSTTETEAQQLLRASAAEENNAR